MARSARLLDLIQALRGRRRPVTAAALAGELGVTPRTIYRDVATLMAAGAPIEGEAGLGYVLRPGLFLPPLMLGADEADAVLLGLRLVESRGDAALAAAARSAAAKVGAVLPDSVEPDDGLIAGPGAKDAPHLGTIRGAMRAERRLRLAYTDRRGRPSDRVVWPLAVGFFDAVEMLAAWCEERDDFRHFRLDRIVSAEALPDRMPTRRRVLLRQWRLSQDLDDGS
ncbi:helix-turn-helix transcriptional regulator [Falsiroseomonas sp. HW251]|uniref:helix-turn-helix transcriptional regulator n=1 Tax=Falsiroseomonas sp. HW251 TaxID=3390998 RepID=UPI003D31E127